MKRFISLILCFIMCSGISTNVFAENEITYSYIYEDYDASDYNWISVDSDEADHGKVYIFESYGYSEGDELFSEEFEDGTYIVSMDFKLEGTMIPETQAKIEILSESSKDMTGFYMQDNGDAYIEVRDYSSRRLIPTMVKAGNDWSKWNNYEVVYEKTGTNVNVSQYLNGELLHEAVAIEDNFRLNQIVVSHPESDDFSANLYIDNITCRVPIVEDVGGEEGGEEPSEPPQSGTKLIHEDSDASRDGAWIKQENYDDKYGNVYKFEQGGTYEGTDWFFEPFEVGTYIVSMDFKVDQYPVSGTAISISTASEAWNDRATIALRATGVLAYTIRDAEAERTGYQYKYGTNYSENAWNNYSIVYEKKSETEVVATQYVNGVKVQEGVTLSDNFRFRRIIVVTSAERDIYIDNISVNKVDGISDFEVISKEVSDGELKLTFNKAPAYKSLSQVRLINSKGKSTTITDYSIEALNMTISDSSITADEEYTVKFNSSFTDTLGNQLVQESDGPTGDDVPEISGESDLSMYGVIASSDGETQVFAKDATVTYDGERRKNILNLISTKEESVGLKSEIMEKNRLERIAVSFDFKVGPNAYINNVAISGSKEAVRIKRSGHEASHFIIGGEYVERLTGGALIKKIPWPEDGSWTNVCFVTTSSGVELYINNEFLAKSPYYIGEVIDVLAQFKASEYSYMDNFRLVNLDDCVFTAKTNGLVAYENDNGDIEVCLSFTTPVDKQSLDSIVITDENGEIVQTGTVEFFGTNVYIGLPEGEAGSLYNVKINEPTGIGQVKYVELSEKPSVMSSSFEDSFGNKTSYSPSLPAFLTSASVMLSGVFEEDALKSAISVTTDGEKIPFDITVREDEKYGVTFATCHFSKRLSPDTTYELTVSGSLESKDKGEVLGESTTYLFKTSDCDDLMILSGIKDGTVSGNVTLYKKSDNVNKFIQGALKKSTVTMIVDGVEREVEQLDDLNIDVKVTGNNFEGEVEMPELSEYDGYSYFLWTWPGMRKITETGLLIESR